MKKLLSILAVLVLIYTNSIFSLGANLKDGTYKVPVTLIHKEEEKESFGGKFISSTALLKVENGKTTVTILLTTSMNNITFYYYNDGSLEGDTTEAKPVSDITVKGETYKQGFEIPVLSSGDIGLKFSVPVMPMSPSARLRIDYSKAVAVSKDSTEPTLKTEDTTSSTAALTETTESTTTIAATEKTTTATTEEVFATATATATSAASLSTTEAVESPLLTNSSSQSTGSVITVSIQRESSHSTLYAVLFVLGIVIITLILSRKSERGKQ